MGGCARAPQLSRGVRPMQGGMETLKQRIARVVGDEITISPYDPRWPESFRQEREYLQSCLPSDLVRRIEHFGSTAVPGLAAKPVVDILVEVTDLQATKERIAPVLVSQSYEYFWRPTYGEDGPPSRNPSDDPSDGIVTD